MRTETISQVEISDDGSLILYLESGGNPSYQYVYRAAAGVYWDQELKAFKFATQYDGMYVKWFSHMLKVISSEMGLLLNINCNARWTNVPDEDRDAMCATI